MYLLFMLCLIAFNISSVLLLLLFVLFCLHAGTNIAALGAPPPFRYYVMLC